MWIVFAVFGVVAVTCLVVFWTASGAHRRERDRAAREVREAVTRTLGLQIGGDPLGSCTLRGPVHGVELRIEVGAERRLPGPSEDTLSVTVFTAEAPLADQIVCRKS